MRIINNIKYISILAIALMVTISSCSDTATEPDFAVPETYEFLRDGESTVSFSGQTTRILMAEELTSKMKNFDTDETSLLEMFANESDSGGDVSPFENDDLNGSTKSVKSKVAASKDFFSTNVTESSVIKTQFESWIKAQINDIFPFEDELAESGKAGQLTDGTSTRYVNAKGLEYNQVVTKGLIGALMMDQIANNYLSPAVLDEASNIEDNDAGTVAEGKTYTTMEHKWDEAYGYLFGKSASESSPLDDLGADSFLNKYLSKVNGDADFAGIAQEIYDAFKKGRAAIVAGEYGERDKQADIIKTKLSEVIAIRAVYYLQQGKNAFPAYGTAFHDLSEGLGFVYSLRFTRKTGSEESYFTSTEVEGFMSDLQAGNGFWDVTAETLDRISQEIADKFEFTVAQAAE